jgi:hypothetical protein
VIEHGENLETHLLPTFARLRAMTPAERADLRARVADWVGPWVEQFRQQLDDLR